MQSDSSLNPAYLKLDLYCKGLRMDDSCFIEAAGGRKIMRTRAGLGSGLEAILPGNLWTNIPVSESFAARSPYVLHQLDERFMLHRDGVEVTEIELAPRPSWYTRRTTSGKEMTRIGSLQGTYLGIYPSKVCDYWLEKPQRSNCKFCSVGLNLGHDDADEKSIQEVLEVVHAAQEESGITYVDFNTGHYAGDTYLDILEPYIRRVKAETGLLVGVQTPPHHDLSQYDRLKAIGVNRVSFCFEIFDPETFIEICPGKHREYGLERYLQAIEYCASLSRGTDLKNPWVTNGEIIAGLEPPESSIRAIDWITGAGAVPTVCVFRPLRGTDYQNLDPPDTDALVPVFRRLYEACMERGLPIGIAPNVHVSLVLLPEECRSLSENTGRYFLQERLNSVKAWAFGRVFKEQVRKAHRACAHGARAASA